MRIHNDTSPVLAQTFTEPFVVYSAKRFPGVPGMCISCCKRYCKLDAFFQ